MRTRFPHNDDRERTQDAEGMAQTAIKPRPSIWVLVVAAATAASAATIVALLLFDLIRS